MRKIYLMAFVALALFARVDAQAETKVFRGTIAASPVQLTLTRSGDKLSGTYFYQTIGTNLRLAGTIDADGNFKLDEFDAKNVKTGEFKGSWKNEDGRGVLLEGEWTNPQTKESSVLSLGEEMIFFTGAKKLLNKTFVDEKQSIFEIGAEYPVLSGANTATAAKFNKLIKDSVMKEVNEFRKDMLAMKADGMKMSDGDYLEIDYTIAYAGDKAVSIVFGNSSYQGGAHPNHNTFTINFDLAKGKKIELADLFKPSSNYLEAISDYCIKKLEKDEEDRNANEWLSAGAGPQAENFRSWNIMKTGIMINFDPYQVDSYAAGPQEVFIPYSDLKDILRADSVVQSL